MRTLIAALAFALAACGAPSAEKSDQSEAAPQGQSVGERIVTLSNTKDLPDWLLVARQRDCAPGGDCPRGEVHFNQRTIVRRPDGTADIWIQTRHGLPQLFQIDTEDAQTTIHFTVERLHYRFNCASGQFIVVERHILGEGETIVARDEPRQIWRAPVSGSVTGIILPIACRGQ